MSRKKLLLIGAGPTSSLITYNISKSPQLKDKFEIHVWEKCKDIGGRFCTAYNPNNPRCYADLGAQYLTASGYPPSQPYFKSLLENNLLSKINTENIPGFRNDPSQIHYACKFGTSSVVKHFFDQAGSTPLQLHIQLDKRATGVFCNNLGFVVSAEHGNPESFEYVITTIPIPQILELDNISGLIEDNNVKSELEKVRYTSRFGFVLFYDKTSLSNNVGNLTAQPFHFVKDPVIRFWSVENKKRGNDNNEPCAIVAHTSVGFGADNVDKPEGSVTDYLMEKFRALTSITDEPSYVKCHKWTFSQVSQSYVDAPGFIVIRRNLIAAGDSFTKSGFEGCIDSAEKTVQYLTCL